LYDFKKVCLLDDVPKKLVVASQQTIDILISSIFNEKFNRLPVRIVVDPEANKNIISFAKTELNADSKLVQALEKLKLTKLPYIVDAPRLHYESACMFDEIGMYERALDAFVKGSKHTAVDVVVETYDLPITAEYLRKVRVMSKFQEEALLKVPFSSLLLFPTAHLPSYRNEKSCGRVTFVLNGNDSGFAVYWHIHMHVDCI
jgi:hypothetical protein